MNLLQILKIGLNNMELKKFKSPYGKIKCKKCNSSDTSVYPDYFVCFKCKSRKKLKYEEYYEYNKIIERSNFTPSQQEIKLNEQDVELT